ncbi:hypothetical protein PAPHI01_0670 [Pancytospora philotis]|nr:hypothetical protein PAPHI01_0670 [Pancytospora philotis]
MRAKVFTLPIFVDYVRGAAIASAPKLSRIVYANFANLGMAGYSVLENHVLNSLYKCCSEYDCPEVKRTVLDAILPGIGAEDRARYVVLTVWNKGGQLEPFGQLLARFGYAGRLLLHRLFSGLSIESLAKRPEANGDNEPRREFCRTAMRCRYAIKGMFQCLQKIVANEGKKTLLQLAGNGTGQDLAIHTIKAMDRSCRVTLSSAFEELVGSWSDDVSRRGMLLPLVIEFIQIVLGLNFWRANEQTKLRESIVRHVYATCGTKYECFELFRGFTEQQFLSPAIHKYINKELNRDPSPGFVRKYLAYMQEYLTKPSEKAYNFFLALLPRVNEYHTADTRWKSDPERFNLISPRWLQIMFKGLCDSPPKNCDAAELMRGYMRKLDYRVFIRILRACTSVDCKKLAAFMLAHQSAKVTEDYQRRLDLDRQHTDLNNMHRGVLDTLAYAIQHKQRTDRSSVKGNTSWQC